MIAEEPINNWKGLHDVGTWPSALQLLTAPERRYDTGQEGMRRDTSKDKGQKDAVFISILSSRIILNYTRSYFLPQTAASLSVTPTCPPQRQQFSKDPDLE